MGVQPKPLPVKDAQQRAARAVKILDRSRRRLVSLPCCKNRIEACGFYSFRLSIEWQPAIRWFLGNDRSREHPRASVDLFAEAGSNSSPGIEPQGVTDLDLMVQPIGAMSILPTW
jgi:hypothetical protein